ncbi:NADPH-dependent FMN reductase [Amycolatopsis antarctica]|uniref:NADPH-dependent FMN reductase n=1 Tax=Amycolatopsis antarctica TaxID=1854586 RepID=A0A263CZG2_9PSEU|nr:NAD(P)H-dependent oxidoreductase [Amycolatopsis antarctica]OZM71278.1 NADPH-dependent FMN reductase [Amycolatopsis antarctica]
MSEQPLKLAVIIGSTRSGRFGPTAAEWFGAQARSRTEVSVDVIDLAQTWLPDVLPGDDATEQPGPVAELSPWLAGADAFVLVTPEYNHSFPAPLKNAIDWFYEEWQAKPVGYVSYGGLAGGTRAVEALRPVLNELHAVSMRTSVSFPNYPDTFGTAGTPANEERYAKVAHGMLDELVWWGEALRAQRERRAYPAGAAE